MFSAASCGVGEVSGRWPSARVGSLSSVCANVTVVRQKRSNTHRETMMTVPAIDEAESVYKAGSNKAEVQILRKGW